VTAALARPPPTAAPAAQPVPWLRIVAVVGAFYLAAVLLLWASRW
jgi:hypothetical protein